MRFVTVWDVVSAIGAEIEVSAVERASTLRLQEEVEQPREAAAPSPLSGKTMGDLREEVISGLARSFARATTISRSAALLHYVLHHAEQPPQLFDLRLTGLPLLNNSALSELQTVLAKASKFEERLITALGKGKFRDYPRHGGSTGIGLIPDDWTSSPTDPGTLQKLTFRAAEIKSLLVGVRHGAMHDAFTGEVISDTAEEAEPDNRLCDSETSTSEADGPAAAGRGPDPSLVTEPQRNGSLGKKRARSGDPAIREAVLRTIRQGVRDKRIGLNQAFLALQKLAVEDELGLVYLPGDKGDPTSARGVHYMHDDKPMPLSPRAFKARASVFWDELLKVESSPAAGRPSDL